MRSYLSFPGSLGSVENVRVEINSRLSAETPPTSRYILKQCFIGSGHYMVSWLPYIGAVVTTITAWLNFINSNSNDHVTPTEYYELLYQDFFSHFFQKKKSISSLLMLGPFAFNLRLIMHELMHIKDIEPSLENLSVGKQKGMRVVNVCFSFVSFLMVFSGLVGSSANIYPLPNKQEDMNIYVAALIFSLPVLPMFYRMSLFNNMILKDGIFAAKCFLNDSCDSDMLLNSNHTELIVKPRHKILFVAALILAVALTFPSELLLAADIDNKYVRWILCMIMVIPESLFHLSHYFVLRNKTNSLIPKGLKEWVQVILSALGHALPSVAAFLYYLKRKNMLFIIWTLIATLSEFLLSLPEAVIHNDHNHDHNHNHDHDHNHDHNHDHKHDCTHSFNVNSLLTRRPQQEDSRPEPTVDPLVCLSCE